MAQMPREKTPAGPSAELNFARSQPSTIGKSISEFGDELVGLGKVKKDVEDTIEANELLADFSIKARDLQSSVSRSDLRHDQIVPEFQKQLEDLQKDTISRARSQDVRDALSVRLPSQASSKVGEIQHVSDQRFLHESLAGYERDVQKNTRAYASASTDDERNEIRERHIRSIDILTSRGVLSQEHKEKEKQKFSRGIELFDVQRAIQASPESGLEAILNPKKFLEKYPNVKVDDLDEIFSKSVQVEELQHKRFERKRKDARESVVSVIDEAVIRGNMDFDTLNQIRDKNLLSPDDYRRNATAIQKIVDEGGVDDPQVKGHLDTQIRLNPYSVSPRNLVEHLNRGGLSRKGVNELLDLREKWMNIYKENAADVDPRFKGPLFQEGKSKIDQLVGRGLTVSGVNVDDNTRRRWAAAMDEYFERVTKDRDKSHQDIANEIIKRYQGPAKTAEILPFKYRDEKKPRGMNAQKLYDDWKREKDPRKKKELSDLIDAIREAKE